MADKYISQSSGVLTEVEATTTSAGAGNAGDIIALDSGGLIDPSMIPGESVLEVSASENLAAGDLVNLHDSTGIKVRKADATTTGKEAIGYVNAAVTSGNTATIYTTGSNTGVSALTVGALSVTPSATRPIELASKVVKFWVELSLIPAKVQPTVLWTGMV